MLAPAITLITLHASGHPDVSFASSGGIAGDNGYAHMSADSCSCTGALGLVNRTISPREPEFHSKRGKVAIEAEVSDLRAASV